LSRRLSTFQSPPPEIVTPADKRRAQLPPFIDVNGGADGTRTRDLRAA
jgi:hypothetical protein